MRKPDTTTTTSNDDDDDDDDSSSCNCRTVRRTTIITMIVLLRRRRCRLRGKCRRRGDAMDTMSPQCGFIMETYNLSVYIYIYIIYIYHPQSAHQHPVLVQVLRTRRQRTFGPCRQVSLVPKESCWMVRSPPSKYLAIYFELISLDLTIKMSHATTSQKVQPNTPTMHTCALCTKQNI